MKTRRQPAAHYRRILSARPHPLQRLDEFATILRCRRDQEIPHGSGPEGDWYCVIAGSVRQCTFRSDGRRQIVDLMLPRDFFFIADGARETTTEAIVEGTVLQAIPVHGSNGSPPCRSQFARKLREVAWAVAHAISRAAADPGRHDGARESQCLSAFACGTGFRSQGAAGIAGVALRHRGLSGCLRRNRLPLHHRAATARRHYAGRQANGQDFESMRPAGSRRRRADDFMDRWSPGRIQAHASAVVCRRRSPEPCVLTYAHDFLAGTG